MPRAERSLRLHLDEAAGPLGVSDAVAILSDVATALADLDGRVVHRDLKPENVLLLNGNWCLADFGISRYADATTAPDTQKYAMSPPYAAPERWRGERATAATDVYSLGVIAYELLSGSLPFAGPAMHDFREQHLHRRAPSLGNVPAPLGALIEECLFKPFEARPTPANVLARLAGIEEPPPSGGLARLQGAAEITRLGEIARRASEHRSDGDRRAALFDAADIGFRRISDTLEQEISRVATAATVQPGRDGGWCIRLDKAELELVPPRMTSESPWESWQPPAFEVIAQALVGIRIPPGRDQYGGRVPRGGVGIGRPGSPWRVGPLRLMRPRRAA
jgi:eukaryotic-like serine/threonine-protein kinase